MVERMYQGDIVSNDFPISKTIIIRINCSNYMAFNLLTRISKILLQIITNKKKQKKNLVMINSVSDIESRSKK